MLPGSASGWRGSAAQALIFLAAATTASGFGGQIASSPLRSSRTACESKRAKSDSLVKMSSDVPKIVAFDLDATLWVPEMYELWGGGAPFTKQPDGTLKDRSGRTCRMMGNTAALLLELNTDPKWKDSKVAYCSCTDEPSWAAECMRLFEVGEGINMDKAAPIKQIFKSSKSEHFRRIHEATGVPYNKMIFFDNEEHNCRTVSKLGVTCIYTPRGMTEGEWKRGLQEYSKNNK